MVQQPKKTVSTLALSHPPVRAAEAQLRAVRQGITKHLEVRLKALTAELVDNDNTDDSSAVIARRLARTQRKFVDKLMDQLEKSVCKSSVAVATTGGVGVGVGALQAKYEEYETLVQAVASKRRHYQEHGKANSTNSG
jgi:hypothetical protein